MDGRGNVPAFKTCRTVISKNIYVVVVDCSPVQLNGIFFVKHLVIVAFGRLIFFFEAGLVSLSLFSALVKAKVWPERVRVPERVYIFIADSAAKVMMFGNRRFRLSNKVSDLV